MHDTLLKKESGLLYSTIASFSSNNCQGTYTLKSLEISSPNLVRQYFVRLL